MSDYSFSHGEQVECPECPAITVGRRGKQRLIKPLLICTEQNYSGCGVDMGNCEECGKGFRVSFKVAEVTREPSWDGQSREEIEAEEAKERARKTEQKAKKDRETYEKLKKQFEDEV